MLILQKKTIFKILAKNSNFYMEIAYNLEFLVLFFWNSELNSKFRFYENQNSEFVQKIGFKFEILQACLENKKPNIVYKAQVLTYF